MEEFFRKENQAIVAVLIGVTLLFVISTTLLIRCFLSRKKMLEKELDQKKAELSHQKEITQSVIMTQEQERKRIARDLHDDISSKLNVINLNANILKDGDFSLNENGNCNNAILDLTYIAIESARKIAHNLLPPILEKFGLIAAIEELADDFNNSKLIQIDYNINAENKILKPQNELHLFRIVQELINNSVSHGNASNCKLTISCEDSLLFMDYTDNGIGFDTNDLITKKGLGLKNIDSRVSLLNGNYKIKSNVGEGFNIAIEI